MRTRTNFAAILNKLLSISLTLLLFAACQNENNPVDPNGGNPINEPLITEYTSPTRGWFEKTNINGITSTGEALSPTPGGGGWMTAYSNINVGIFEHPVVTAYIENDHTGNPGNYRVETNFSWDGSIAGNGIAGAGARVEMSLEIRDLNGNLITTYDIAEKEVIESFLQIGGIRVQGNKNISVDFNLAQGKTGFKVRFIMKTEAWSGFFGAITQSHFWDRANLGRGAGLSLLKITELKN
jgi:hypothetical protein